MSRVDGARWRCKVEECSELVEQSEMEEHLRDAHNVHDRSPQGVLDAYVLAIGSPSRGYYRREKGEDKTDQMFPDWREHTLMNRETE